MAEENDHFDKTEDPSQRKLDEAHKRGDVVKSQEVNTWFVIGAATLVFFIFAPSASQSLSTTFAGLMGNAYRLPADGRGLLRLGEKLGIEVLAAIAIPMLLLALAAIAGNMIQHRLVWSAESLKPKLSKISPVAGFKRLFSKQALAYFVKGVAKLVAVGAVMGILLWPQRHALEHLIGMPPAAALGVAHAQSLYVLGWVVAVLTVVAALDYFWQYHHWFERQKMSLRELKDEFKQTEGDPAIKSRIRQIRQNRARKRMMAAVPQASVVITNPTHYAIALKYESGMNAPVCLAKGVDSVALRIREVAGAHRIPVVENPPLARALHATVDLDQEIPPEHYKAVAEVIGYVLRLRKAVVR